MSKKLLIALSVLCLLLVAAGCNKASKAGGNADSGAQQTIPASEQHGSAAAADEQHMDMHDDSHGDMHGDSHGDMDKSKSTSPASGHPFTLANCPVSGEELGGMGDPVHYNHDGRNIAFCCQACVPKFEADPAKYIAEIDRNMIEQQMEEYPVATCPVSGEQLGTMGETVDIIHDNRLVRFCCAGCVKDFKADPDKFISMIDEAVVAAQAADYPLEMCVVSGEDLGAEGTAIDYVVGTTLVRLCCEDCRHDVDAHPAKYIEMVHEARGGKA